MKRIVLLALIALTGFSGVAAADRRAPDLRDHRGGVSATHSHGRYEQRPHYSGRGRYVARPTVRYVRRPIYVQRPHIAFRYYNYDRRPARIVENYPPMAGYLWVAGQWSWNGYEWLWMPGHYEPDPGYGYDGY